VLRHEPAVVVTILRLGIWAAAIGALCVILVPQRPGRFLEFDLDVGGEGNAFAWASTVATFAAAYASALLAIVWRERAVRFATLAVCFAYFSLDDMAQIHERAGASLFHKTLELPSNVSEQLELTLYAPLFLLALWVVWSLIGEMPPRTSRILVTGVALLGLAVVAEFSGLVTRRLEEHDVPLVNGVRLGIEEAAELAGWILVASALTALFCAMLASPGPLAERTR
jgi:hypothetical protein